MEKMENKERFPLSHGVTAALFVQGVGDRLNEIVRTCSQASELRALAAAPKALLRCFEQSYRAASLWESIAFASS